MTYRLSESGIERVEDGASTFIPADPTSAAWAEYESWRAAGREPAPAPLQPTFVDRTKCGAPLWIVGAGGFGREVHSLTPSCRGFERDWHVAGFLNDLPDALADFPELPPIGGTTDCQPQPGDRFICAIGEVEGRLRVCEKLQSRGARFIHLVSTAAMISGVARLGEGVIVEAFTGVGAHAQVGDFTTILSHTTIGHDVKIGRAAQISSYCDIHGWAEIGERCLIGSHAVILAKVRIGDGATVGAGSVVISDVPAGATVFGVPAKRLQ